MAVSTVECCSDPKKPDRKTLILAPASCIMPDRTLNFQLQSPSGLFPFFPLRWSRGHSLRAEALAISVF